MADLEQKINKVDAKNSKVSDKISKLGTKVEETNSPLKLRFYKLVMQRLQNKLFKIQDKRNFIEDHKDTENEINSIYDINLEYYFGNTEGEMQDRWSRLQDIGRRLKDIENEKKFLYNHVANRNDEEKNDPELEKMNRKYNRTPKNIEENGNPVKEDNEDNEYIKGIVAQMDELDKERKALKEERTGLHKERKDLVKEYKTAVNEVEKARKKDLALVNPNIFRRIISFIKNKVEEMKSNREERKEEKKAKVSQMKADISNTKPSDGLRERLAVDVDYDKIKESIDQKFTKEKETREDLNTGNGSDENFDIDL